MSNTPLISVLMSVYNEPEEWLKLAIESILTQTVSDFEFIIVNDNPERLENSEILAEYAARDARIVVVTNEKNMGLVAALNNGLAHVRGKYVARMDADDISYPERFQKELEYMQTAKCDLVAAYVDHLDENGDMLIKGTVRGYSVEAVMHQLRYDNFVCHPAWLVKTEVYRALGGYRNVYSAEDFDFLLHAIYKGYRVGLCNAVLLGYRINTKSISRKNALRQLLTMNYLMAHSDCMDEVSIDEINSIVDKRVTEKNEKKYLKAQALIRKAAAANKLCAVFLLFKAVCTSKYAWNNIRRMVGLRLVRIKYRRDSCNG